MRFCLAHINLSFIILDYGVFRMDNEVNRVSSENELSKLLMESIIVKFNNQKYAGYELGIVYARGLGRDINNYLFMELNPQVEGRVEVIIIVGSIKEVETKYFHISSKTDPLDSENVEYFFNSLEIFEITSEEHGEFAKNVYGIKKVHNMLKTEQ